MAKLANVEATFDGVGMPGVFGNEYVETLGMGGSRPVLRVLSSELPVPPARGKTLLIDGVEWKVSESHLDSGETVVVLEKV